MVNQCVCSTFSLLDWGTLSEVAQSLASPLVILSPLPLTSHISSSDRSHIWSICRSRNSCSRLIRDQSREGFFLFVLLLTSANRPVLFFFWWRLSHSQTGTIWLCCAGDSLLNVTLHMIRLSESESKVSRRQSTREDQQDPHLQFITACNTYINHQCVLLCND